MQRHDVDVGVRQAHAVLDLQSRRSKGEKIKRLLGLDDEEPICQRLLEVGTGSGGIALYFATNKPGRYVVDAVDVVDNRIVMEGYTFTKVDDTQLPFADQTFDIVISNHVIEHVGTSAEQLSHLRELRRVLSADGVLYLAVPNRWMFIEPHFRLPFLSWLPMKWRDSYVRAARKGAAYDCRPLELGQLETMLSRASLRFQNICVPAVYATLEIESPVWAKLVKLFPEALLRLGLPMIPTLIYRCGRNCDTPGSAAE